MTAPLTGLTAAEVAERQARGRINRQVSESNRTYGDSLRLFGQCRDRVRIAF
ncbi:MAG: hypothetical protein ACK4K5_03995 [Thermosynechococcus sp.]|uniref:hypothetical protein n=1 Tax=Thermosynechococcus sp. TaxID=2814275 RepID=UPI0039189486